MTIQEVEVNGYYKLKLRTSVARVIGISNGKVRYTLYNHKGQQYKFISEIPLQRFVNLIQMRVKPGIMNCNREGYYDDE